MQTVKMKFLKAPTSFLIGLSLLISIVGILGIARTVAAAAPPGCYEKQAGDQLYHQRTCPPENQTAVLAGKCFIKIIQPRVTTAYTEAVCDTIDAGSIVPLDSSANQFFANPAGDCPTGDGKTCITNDIQIVINFLSIGVGVVTAAMIIVGGIQYMTSRDNPQAVQAAKSKIFNAVIAIVAYVFVWAFLQWVVPGGVL